MALAPAQYMQLIWDQLNDPNNPIDPGGGSQPKLPDWGPDVVIVAPNGPPIGVVGVELIGANETIIGIEILTTVAHKFKIWLYADSKWYCPPGGNLTGIVDPWAERISTTGFEWAYVEVVEQDDDVIINIGPCTIDP